MNINATLFIQMFNFFITYWMLRFFLFKPVVAIIEHEQAQEKSLHDIINQQKKSLDIQEKERQRNWYACQEYFAMHQPSLSHLQQSILDSTEYDTEITSPISDEAIANMITDVRNALEEKIKHVH